MSSPTLWAQIGRVCFVDVYKRQGGIYITSGILDVKEEEVRQAVERAGLKVVEVTRQGEWVSVTARKD